jgi:hypothetical protein
VGRAGRHVEHVIPDEHLGAIGLGDDRRIVGIGRFGGSAYISHSGRELVPKRHVELVHAFARVARRQGVVHRRTRVVELGPDLVSWSGGGSADALNAGRAADTFSVVIPVTRTTAMRADVAHSATNRRSPRITNAPITPRQRYRWSS